VSVTRVIRAAAGILLAVMAIGGGKAFYVVYRALIGKGKQRMAHNLAAAIKAKKHISLHEIPVDPDEDRGIILLAIFRVSGDIEIAPIFAEHARLAIVQTENGDADAPAIVGPDLAVVGPDLDAHDEVPLHLDVIPRSVEIGWLAIKRIAGLRLDGGAAQQKKHKDGDNSHTALYS